MRKSRIVFLLLAAVLTAGAIFLTKPQNAFRLEEPLTLCVAVDLHYIAPELTDNGAYFTRIVENGDGKAMLYCEEITDAFVSQIVAQKPDALVLAGDLTFNGAKASHEALAAKLRAIRDAGIAVLVIPGNHDLESPMAAAFHEDAYTLVESVTAPEFAEIYADFGYGEARARDESSLSYVAELSPQLWALMVDVNTPAAPGALREETLSWARRQLDAAHENGVRVIAVSHQNVLPHNSVFHDGFVMENGEALQALYERRDVWCNLSGHMHVQHIARSDAGLTEIASSALVTSPCQYGILALDGSKASYRTEPVAFSHAEDARQFLWDLSRRTSEEECTDDDLCRFFADVNTAYLAGRGDRMDWDEAQYDALRRQTLFLGAYLQSLRDDGFQDHTQRVFPLR